MRRCAFAISFALITSLAMAIPAFAQTNQWYPDLDALQANLPSTEQLYPDVGSLPPLEELSESDAPEQNPAVPKPVEEAPPPGEPEEPISNGNEVYVHNGPVQPHVQQFANDACYAVGTCTVSTYEGHQPARDRALDFLISSSWGTYPNEAEVRQGNQLANFALNNRGTYRVYYVIWRNRIAGSWNNYQWEAYGGSGPTDGHYDHVHVGFFH